MSSLRYNPINLSSLFGTHQINQIVKGWINYFRIGKTKMFINVVNFLLNGDILAMRKGERPRLVNPFEYGLR